MAVCSESWESARIDPGGGRPPFLSFMTWRGNRWQLILAFSFPPLQKLFQQHPEERQTRVMVGYKRVALRDIGALTFFEGQKTAARRTSPIREYHFATGCGLSASKLGWGYEEHSWDSSDRSVLTRSSTHMPR